MGATSASILFAFDVQADANGGHWNVTIGQRTLDSVLIYKDTDIDGGMVRWSKPSSAEGCVVNRYWQTGVICVAASQPCPRKKKT